MSVMVLHFIMRDKFGVVNDGISYVTVTLKDISSEEIKMDVNAAYATINLAL